MKAKVKQKAPKKPSTPEQREACRAARWKPTLATRAIRTTLGIKADLANADKPIVVNVIGPANVIVEGSLRTNYAKILYRGVEYIVPESTLEFPVTEVVSAGEHLRGGV